MFLALLVSFLGSSYSIETYKDAIYSIIFSLLLLVPSILLIVKGLKYVLCFNIAYDNSDMEINNILEKSETIMNKKVKKYFLLMLSFIGWYILLSIALQTFAFLFYGILINTFSSYTIPYYIMIFIKNFTFSFLPTYMCMSHTIFYEEMKEN